MQDVQLISKYEESQDIPIRNIFYVSGYTETEVNCLFPTAWPIKHYDTAELATISSKLC